MHHLFPYLFAPTTTHTHFVATHMFDALALFHAPGTGTEPGVSAELWRRGVRDMLAIKFVKCLTPEEMQLEEDGIELSQTTLRKGSVGA